MAGPKTAKRSAVAVEQLDHRRLLSVNFTGNVATDFPATTITRRRHLQLLEHARHHHVAASSQSPYADLIKTSGYAISEIRVSYDSADDTLSVGFEQPPADPSNPHPGR